MDSPVKSAPLTLLIGDTASDVDARLQVALTSSSGFAVSDAGLMHGAAYKLLYRGCALVVSVKTQIGDLSALKQIFCNLDPVTSCCGVEIGLDEHVAGGERVPAIIQALLGAAEALGSSLSAVGVIWHPANVVTGLSYFSDAVSGYLAGGSFPVLALVNFRAEADGSVISKGLAYLSDQELLVLPAAMEQSELMRRVVRVVHDVAVNGPMLESVRLAGIEPGETLELEPLLATGVLKVNAYPGTIA